MPIRLSLSSYVGISFMSINLHVPLLIVIPNPILTWVDQENLLEVIYSNFLSSKKQILSIKIRTQCKINKDFLIQVPEGCGTVLKRHQYYILHWVTNHLRDSKPISTSETYIEFTSHLNSCAMSDS